MKAIAVLCVLALWAVGQKEQPPFGKFLGDVVTKWNDDGRTMTLVEALVYVDPEGHRWDAPKGSQLDGASIPRIAWTTIGGPFEGAYRKASVIHDVACVRRTEPWQRVHRAFYNGMRAERVHWIQAKIMYAGVYHFGPRWDKESPRTLAEADFPQLVERIKRSQGMGASSEPDPGMPLEAIEDFKPQK